MSEIASDSTPSETQPPASPFESIVRRWWMTLDGRRGDRAGLRRARTPSEVCFEPAYHRLLRDVRQTRIRVDDERLPVIAGVIAHVEQDDFTRTFATQMALEHNGKARVSGLRFRRLLAVDDTAELQTSLIRMIHLLDRTAPVGDLADSIRWWNDRTKKQWAVDYYGTAPTEA